MARTSAKRNAAVNVGATPGNGKNSWTYNQRLVLRLLFIDFDLNGQTITTIFNKLFADHLKSCGLPKGLSVSAIQAQFRDRYRKSVAEQWKTICADSVTPEEGAKRDALRKQIRRKLGSLNYEHESQGGAPIRDIPTPGVTPPHTPAKRLRNTSLVTLTDSSDTEDTEQPAAKKPKQREVQAIVVISSDEQEAAIRDLKEAALISPPKTPSRSRSASAVRRPNATILYAQPSGSKILLTPKERRETLKDPLPPTAAEAHPYVPLLFRYSTAECQSPLTETGFLAGRFAASNILPQAPPSLQRFPWRSAFRHLNRDKDRPSPFVSTSNNFIWILRLALKEKKRNANGGLISVIDPRMLEQGSVFHAQPFHRELSKKHYFDKGAFLYRGMREFLVFGQIRKEAIIHTFQVEMLLKLADRNADVGALLRLEQIIQPNTGQLKIQTAFKQQNMQLTDYVITGMAHTCKALGLEPTMVEAVASLLTDLIEGYGIILKHKSAQEWREAASTFGKEMYLGSPKATLLELEGMKYAFLNACRWANGECNVKQKPRRMSTMLNKAKKIGLESPARILMSELEDAKTAIRSHDVPQQMLLRGSASQGLLAYADGEHGVITPPATPGHQRIDCGLTEDDDDDDLNDLEDIDPTNARRLLYDLDDGSDASDASVYEL